MAAEQGVIGLAAYLALMAAALALVFHGLRARLRGDPGIADVAAAATAAAFCALVLHTLVYAAFLEDPLSWTLLAIAAVLGGAGDSGRRAPGRRQHALRNLVAMLTRRKLLIAAAAAIVLLGAAGAAAYVLVLKKPGDISNPDVPFVDGRADA